MALQSQVWSPATPIPMAESSLYRQRLEVIAMSIPRPAPPLSQTPPPEGQASAESGRGSPAPPRPARPLLSQRLRSPLPAPARPPCSPGAAASPTSHGGGRAKGEEVGSPILCAQEKLRLQEEIRAARGELEEEKLRVERLKRKSLRERWLMDGAEGPEGPEEATLQDPQAPEGQAQDRIRNLEDSLFTLQSQLQLLQSASTGAQHKPSGRPTWRRQGHRPLSQPTVEAGTEGQTDLNKRASLPAEPVGTSLESLAEPRDEAFGVLPALRQVPGAAGVSSEANGPCPRPSPPLEQEHNEGVTAAYGGVAEAKGGGVVKVVWEGLRATEDCARGATGPELEAKVEEMVLEAIGDRLEASHPELPSWVKEDRGVVEVVWEGVGGTEGSDSEASGEAGRGPQAAQTSSPQTSSPRLQEGLEAAASGKGEGPPRGSPDGFRQGGSGGEEGSFIWVERVTLSEEWEELLVEGLEGPRALGKLGGDESPLGRLGGEETWEMERRQAEESLGTWKKGSEETAEEKAGAEWEGIEVSLVAEKKGREQPLKPERRGGEGKVETEREGDEEALSAESEEAKAPLRAEREGDEEALSGESEEAKAPLRAEREGDEEPLGTEQSGREEELEAEKKAEELPGVESKAVEGSLSPEKEGGEEKLRAEEKEVEEAQAVEKKGDEEKLEATEEPLTTEREEGEGSLTVAGTRAEEPRDEEKKGGEESLKAEGTGSEEPSEAEKSQEVEEDAGPEEQRKPGIGEECQAEEVSEAGASPGAKEELRPEEEGPQQPQEKQEGSPEEEAEKPQTPAEGQDPSGDATALLAETPAPEPPTECQPLLPVEKPKANPSARPVPTYAPAQQPEPPAPPEGEEASGPKQKTCQCCAVM